LVAAEAPGAGKTVEAVIVGAGPAGDAVAAGLIDGDFNGLITLIGSEQEMPYERPHLSKGYLLGTVSRDGLALRPPEQYRKRIVVMRGERIVRIDLEREELTFESGRVLEWDLLCMATGSDARRLEGFPDATYLRELADADRLKARIDRGDALEIIGAGFIGCEVAAVARRRGCEVTVHEALEQPLVRVLGHELGGYIGQVHRERGVDLRLNAETPSGADLVAIGSKPRTELAERAGLEVDRGIVVDELGRTSADGVFAAGDVTRFSHPLYGTRVRVEHFQTSQRQGFAVGRTMAGAETAYTEVPWFWSDQYDLNLQYAGAGLPWDEMAVRGELGKPPFTVFYLSGGKLIAAAGINDHHTVARARHAMESRRDVTRAQLEDPNFDLRRGLA